MSKYIVVYETEGDYYLGPINNMKIARFKDYYKKLKSGSVCPNPSVLADTHFFDKYEFIINAIRRRTSYYDNNKIGGISFDRLLAVPVYGTSISSEDHVLAFDESKLFLHWLEDYAF